MKPEVPWKRLGSMSAMDGVRFDHPSSHPSWGSCSEEMTTTYSKYCRYFSVVAGVKYLLEPESQGMYVLSLGT